MGVFTLKWVSLGVALLLLLHWGTPTVDAHEDGLYGEEVQQQRRSCEQQRLSSCREYLERRRYQPSERCCEELQRMSPQCRCQAIQQTLEDVFMDSDSQDGAPLNQRFRQCRVMEEEEVVQRAEELPNTCNVRQSPRRCDLQRHSRKSLHERYQLFTYSN